MTNERHDTDDRDERRVETLRETLTLAAEAGRRARDSDQADERDAAALEHEALARAGLALTVGEEPVE